MKSFRDFLEQIYTLDESSKEELEARMSAAYGNLIRKKRRKRSIEGDAILHVVKAGKRGRSKDVVRMANNLSKIFSSPQKRASAVRKRTIQDLRQHHSEDDYVRANKKVDKLNRVGLHAHHITPLHYSRKLKASMPPEDWKKRLHRDAKDGIFHGHHHKNIMGAVVDTTPEPRSRRGIRHHSGGAHELEHKTKDLYSTGVSHKALLAAQQRRRLRGLSDQH